MPDVNEVRAAAERHPCDHALAKATAERILEYDRQWELSGTRSSHAGDVALARAYLAEHPPDDGEAATVTWLESEFPDLDNSSGSPYQRRYEFWGGTRIIAKACQGGFEPFELWTGSADRFKSRAATRRDVRQLMRLLGVEGKESTDDK